VIAPYLLNETVSRTDWIATWIIVCGVVLVTSFGDHCSSEYTVQELLDLWDNPAFQAVEATAPVAIIGCIVSVKYILPEKIKDEELLRQWKAVIFSVLAGFFGGQSNLFFKAAGECLEKTLGGDASSWATWVPYVYIVALVITATGQLNCINEGIRNWHVVKTFPVYNAALIFCSTVYGGTYYQEYKNISTSGLIIFPIAVIVVMVGVLVLMQRGEHGESSTVEPEDKEGEEDVKPVPVDISAHPLHSPGEAFVTTADEQGIVDPSSNPNEVQSKDSPPKVTDSITDSNRKIEATSTEMEAGSPAPSPWESTSPVGQGEKGLDSGLTPSMPSLGPRRLEPLGGSMPQTPPVQTPQ